MPQNNGCVSGERTHAPAIRLWLLERPEAVAPLFNVCRYAGAVAVLADTGVHVAIVMAPDTFRAGTALLESGSERDRERFYRHGCMFATLHEALMWADARKADWCSRGWRPAGPPPEDH